MPLDRLAATITPICAALATNTARSRNENMTEDVLPPPRPQRSTMIKGLTPRLPERGHVKIGTLGAQRKSTRNPQTTYQLPQKLDHFRVTTMQRGEDGNFLIDRALYEKLGLPEEPTELPVRLLYDDIALNFPTRYACFAGK